MRTFCLDRIFYGFDEKVEKSAFSISEFCFHDTTSEANLTRLACAMNMVDCAFEKVDVTCSQRNNGIMP